MNQAPTILFIKDMMNQAPIKNKTNPVNLFNKGLTNQTLTLLCPKVWRIKSTLFILWGCLIYQTHIYDYSYKQVGLMNQAPTISIFVNIECGDFS